MNKVIRHYGVLGMKWGIRNYQNPDGSLTRKGRARLERKDEKWVKKRGDKIKQKAQAAVSKDLERFAKTGLNPQFRADGKLTSSTILKYNNKMAQLMNAHIGNIPVPSGRVIRFVAQRGSIGVYTGYADADYNMNLVRQGVFESGKVGYRNENLMTKGE